MEEELAASVEHHQLQVGSNAIMQMEVNQLLPEDRIILSIMYHQLLVDILRLDHYDVTRDEYVRICAWHKRIVEAKLFDMIGVNPGPHYNSIQSLQPGLIPPAELAEFHRQVQTLASTLTTTESYSPFLLMAYFASRPQLGFQAFTVANEEIKVLPSTLWIGVSLHGLFLIDHTTKCVLKAFKFTHLAGWAANQVKFSVRVLIGRGKTQQINFACKQGKRITATIQEFVDVIVEQQKPKSQAPTQ